MVKETKLLIYKKIKRKKTMEYIGNQQKPKETLAKPQMMNIKTSN